MSIYGRKGSIYVHIWKKGEHVCPYMEPPNTLHFTHTPSYHTPSLLPCCTAANTCLTQRMTQEPPPSSGMTPVRVAEEGARRRLGILWEVPGATLISMELGHAHTLSHNEIINRLGGVAKQPLLGV